LQKEIEAALKKTNEYLEEAIKAVVNKNEVKVREMIWKASSELEYFLFLLSMAIGEDNLQKANPRLGSDPKIKGEIGPFLVSIQDLLTEAQKLLQRKSRIEAYVKAKAARNGLLRLHTTLERQMKAKK